MTKRMLIDATHAEETRVVVLDGNRLEDFDVETSTKRQLKGNIYLAKVVRVEPSLQAAFVEYGGGRHGFLAFGEIHPDYYQIPIADRQRLLALQAEEARAEAEAEEAEATARASGRPAPPAEEPEAPTSDDVRHVLEAETLAEIEPETVPIPADFGPLPGPEQPVADEPNPIGGQTVASAGTGLGDVMPAPEFPAVEAAGSAASPGEAETGESDAGDGATRSGPDRDDLDIPPPPAQAAVITREERFGPVDVEAPDVFVSEPIAPADDEIVEPYGDELPADLPPPETIGGDTEQSDAADEARARRASRFLRNYRIQEVIKRRQIMLVQVVKEERGTKGAALTTYISLAGRYCVLMPNSPRGGGISRKITSASDRRRLKEITAELDIPQGMGLIVRTAGANRPKPEIKRDCEYLMRLWDDIREHTLRSVAPALIYEEASLIKRAIRDVYSRDIDEVTVDGEDGWKAAHDFMRMLMPGHAKKVQLWRGNGGGANQPLFAKYQVEAQLDAMLAPTVQLRSGGYLVINQAEALVAIDVNSGRATRERGIEETALRTNLEAADEVARQLRLRDLAGLIVIDFIDMEAKKHNALVERRLKEALKIDRARIQVGHISHFGLMEMSRQRLRPSLAETSFVTCPHCGGLGHVRSTESAAIHVLRTIEDEGAKGRAALIMVNVASAIALYLLNNKRERLAEIEARYAMRVHFQPDDTLVPPQIRIDRLKPQVPEGERPSFAPPVAPAAPALPAGDEEDAEEFAEPEALDAAPAETPAPTRAEPRSDGEENGGRRRRRRRRRGGRRDQPEAGRGVMADGDVARVELDAFDEGPEGEDAAEPEEFAGAAPELSAERAPEGDLAATDQPSLDGADLDENGLPKPRRRGRRGGRRRRREDETEQQGQASQPAPTYTATSYSGPTPADPFGGGPFDIFEMMDAAEQDAPALSSGPTVAPTSDEASAEADEAGVPPDLEPPPASAVAAPEPPPIAPEPEPGPVSAEPTVGPAIKPLVIGQDELPVAERKRGWWSR